MNVFNVLETQCNELHAAVEALRKGLPGGEKTESCVNELSVTIFGYSRLLGSSKEDNSRIYQLLVNDLEGLKSPNVARLRLIEMVETIQYRSKLNRIGSEPKLLAAWLNDHPNAVIINESDFQYNPEKVLRAFDALQKNVKPPKAFEEIFDNKVSEMVVTSLGFSNLDQLHFQVTDPELKSMALGHFINVTQIPLNQINLSIDELKQVAPYLTEVDCRDVQFKDDNEAQEFIQCCSNAYRLGIHSDEITRLRPPSSKLKYLDCSHCHNLREISVSHLLSLTTLACLDCPKLEELTLKDLPSLRGVSCAGCTCLRQLLLSNLVSLRSLGCHDCFSLKELALLDLPLLSLVNTTRCSSLRTFSLSKLPSLNELIIRHCSSLKEFTLDDFPVLELVAFSYCKDLISCSLSNLPLLKILDCESNDFLKELLLTKLPMLKTLYCHNSLSLEAIVSDGLPSCDCVGRRDCPKLITLPQLAEGANVIS